MPAAAKLTEIIRKEGGEWCVYSHDGKRSFGCYPSEDAAKERLAQIERAKHAQARESVRLVASAHRVRIVGDPIDAEMRRWPIVIIEAGISLNAGPSKLPLYYPPDTLRAAVDVFEGAQSYRNHPTVSEDKERPERNIDDLIGRITDVRFDEATGRLLGTWTVIDDLIHTRVVNSHKLGMMDSFGFSINASGETDEGLSRTEVDGQLVEVVTAISRDAPASVDVVTQPAAGGGFLTRLAASLRASKEGQKMTLAEFKAAKEALFKAILAADTKQEALEAVQSLELEGLSESFIPELEAAWEAAHLEEVHTTADPQPVTTTTTAAPAAGGATVTPAPIAESKRLVDLERTIKLLEARDRTRLVESKLAGLDAPTQEHLRPILASCGSEADMDRRITAHKQYLAKLTEGGSSFPRTSIDGGGHIEVGAGELEKHKTAVYGFFCRADQKLPGHPDITIPRYTNVREMIECHPDRRNRWNRQAFPTEIMASARCWFQGDEHGSYVLREGKRVNLREATTTTSTHAEIFADAAHKRMDSMWHSANDVEEIKAWASDVVFYDDFKTHRIINLGEYANPGSVAEAATYLEAVTPGDLEETNALTKYGFWDSISFEALTDPDGRKLAKLPDRMISAMLRLVRETAINEITTTNPTLNSDSTALYAAGHSNQATTALSIDALNAIRYAMRSQTAPGSSKPIGPILSPWGLIVPNELEGLAMTILNPSDQFLATVADGGANVTLDPATFKQKLRLLVADHFTNATDYYVQADPSKVDTWEFAMLRGVTQPQFFTQDGEDSTSYFDSDTIKWKVRFFLGVEPLNYRSFYYQNVA